MPPADAPPSAPTSPRLPVGILITVALLALYCGFACWLAIAEHSWRFALLAAVTAVACVGAALLKAWSQYLVYLLTAAWIAAWAYSIQQALKAGFFRLVPTAAVVRSLVPDTLLVLLSCYCCYAAFRHFSRRR